MVFIDGWCFTLETLDIFILFERDTILDFAKNLFALLDPHYWYCGSELVKRCKLCAKCCTLSNANTVVMALESVQHIMVWHFLAPVGKIIYGKENTMKL